MKGTVKFFDVTKGWGFITGEDKKDYFVHRSAIQGDSDETMKTLMDGEKVEFDVVDGRKGKQASNVVITEKWHDPREDIVLKIHNEFAIAIPLLSWSGMEVEELESYYNELKEKENKEGK